MSRSQESGKHARSVQPKKLKSLHGFLRVTDYYRKFVRNYGKMIGPLTSLLKNNAFVWSDSTKQAFSALKKALCTTMILSMQNFTKTFVLECDASGRGLKEVLMQEGCPL